MFVKKLGIVMNTVLEAPTKLNDLQISLLRLFSQKISAQETLEVRQLLMNYFDQQLKTELDVVLATKNYTEADFERMSNDDNFPPK